MTIKKQLDELVRHITALKKLDGTPIPICGIDNYIHIYGLDNLAKAAKAAREQVEVSLWGSNQNKWKASFFYQGMEVFALGSDEELAAAGLEAPPC